MAWESWREGLQWGKADGAVPGTVSLSCTSATGSRPHFLLGQIPVDTRGWWCPTAGAGERQAQTLHCHHITKLPSLDEESKAP